VQTDDGPLTAHVVLFDPESDVAVLSVHGLDVPVLHFTPTPAGTGNPAIVLGYPENGPFTVGSARVRERSTVGGRDIYDQRSVQRSIYSIRGVVRSGNSGGPLLADNGSVLGVVFARALSDSDTGYALTYAQVHADAGKGRTATATVGTKSCTSD
jgi:S1-C subfamily serine protease